MTICLVTFYFSICQLDIKFSYSIIINVTVYNTVWIVKEKICHINYLMNAISYRDEIDCVIIQIKEDRLLSESKENCNFRIY